MEHLIAFLFYSYIGATLEHISYSLNKGKPKQLSNPIITGFPLYGIAAYGIITINSFISETIVLQFFIFGIVISLIEYIVGLYVGAGEKSYVDGMVNSWDYSKEPYNLHGIVSLRHFISWGILGIILVRIHPVLIKHIKCAINC